MSGSDAAAGGSDETSVSFEYGNDPDGSYRFKDIRVKTGSLVMTAIQKTTACLAACKEIFQDSEAMAFYDKRRAQTDEEIAQRLDLYDRRLKLGIPFTAFIVKKDDQAVAFVALGFDEKDGWTQVAYASLSAVWSTGILSQVMQALLGHYLPLILKLHGNKMPTYADRNLHIEKAQKCHFQGVCFTAHRDHPTAENMYTRMLTKRGMSFSVKDYEEGAVAKKRWDIPAASFLKEHGQPAVQADAAAAAAAP